MVKHVLVVSLASLLCVTAAQATFIDGFEDGTLSQWTATYGSPSVVSSMAYGATVTPHSGSDMAITSTVPLGTQVVATHSFGSAQTGTLTGYMNTSRTASGYIASIYAENAWGQRIVVMNLNDQLRIYSYVTGNTYPGITFTDHVWHEVKFTVNGGAAQVYWDGNLVYTESNFRNFYYVGFGSFWSTAPAAYDDFSLTPIPEPMTLILLGLGAVGLIRRK